MIKRILNIALAYVGVVIGAGLSSGQDLMQYFVSFGKLGIFGTVVLGVISVFLVRLLLRLEVIIAQMIILRCFHK